MKSSEIMLTKCRLAHLVHEQAKKYGSREVLIYKDFGYEKWCSMSWSEFSSEVRAISNALLCLGVEPQENIGIFSQNAVQYFCCDFGAWGVRAVTVPLYATSSEQQIQFIINDANIRFLFVGEQEQYDKAHRVAHLCSTLQRIIIFDKNVRKSPRDPNSVYYCDFLKLGKFYAHQTEVDRLSEESIKGDIANILYTSGTTGESKGVYLTHEQYDAALEANSKVVPVTENDRVLDFLPLAHVFERGWTLLSLAVGATVIINKDPNDVLKTMRETNPTSMSAVPRFWEKVYMAVNEKINSSNPIKKAMFRRAIAIGHKHNIQYVGKGKCPPKSLRVAYEAVNRTIFSMVHRELGLTNPNIFPTAGATVSPYVEEFVHSIGLKMLVGYGLTETLATVTCDVLDKGFTVGSVGRPLDILDIKISENGEILLKGPTITKGYYNRPELNKISFTEDGYFRTGDCGYIRDGELFLTERIKDLFKTSNGKYIAPQSIESRLIVDKFIDQIAVVADHFKFVSALIVPDFTALEEYAAKHEIKYSSRVDLCNNADIYRMMSNRIDTLQQQLAQYEKIKRFTLLPRHFTIETGELTNTLKLKRSTINDHYKKEIDDMYMESSSSLYNDYL